MYQTYEEGNVAELIRHDFVFWDEPHFKALDKTYATTLRNILLQNSCKINYKSGFPVVAALAEVMKRTWKQPNGFKAEEKVQPPNLNRGTAGPSVERRVHFGDVEPQEVASQESVNREAIPPANCTSRFEPTRECNDFSSKPCTQ